MDDEERYVAEEIPEFGVRFVRPQWWSFRHERGETSDTYVYWDEFTGTLRLTPMRPVGDSLKIDEFLERRFADEQAKNPEWRTYNGRRFVYYVEDSRRELTRLHYLIGGHRDVLLVCSFAYSLELLDDEFSADELDGALEDLTHVFESIELGCAGQ